MKQIKKVLNEELPRSSKGMNNEEQLFQFFASHGGYKEVDPDYLEEVTDYANFIKGKVSSESWKSVLLYMKKAATYQAAYSTIKTLANVLGADGGSYTKGILVKDLKLGLANLVSNGELTIKGSRAYSSNNRG